MKKTYEQFIPTWHLLVESLNDLKKLRRELVQLNNANEYGIASVNASIILHNAAIVEGATKSILKYVLDSNNCYNEAKRNEDFETIRIFEFVEIELEKATWQTISEKMFKLIFGNNLKEYFSDKESIKYLFEFRNIIAHGSWITQKTSHVFDKNSGQNSYDTSITKSDLFKYFFKKKLIYQEFNHTSSLSYEVINCKIVDFFLKESEIFLLNLYNEQKHSCKKPFVDFDLNQIKTL